MVYSLAFVLFFKLKKSCKSRLVTVLFFYKASNQQMVGQKLALQVGQVFRKGVDRNTAPKW
ncbi:hypothetical protein GV64_11900 [Endozoicomonas elysicola]|uniref:Uncharacterized protein n=1 Tax=Endozoicomonas elysicola TaxID=305900 RepID=A0A081KB24_9GAMM|nr:hypothetical protein GV64_11900 [Endozoicomonas elysicola]